MSREKTIKKPLQGAEFFEIIFKILKTEGKVPESLSYAEGYKYDGNPDMRLDEFEVQTTTSHGGNEGIYISISVNGRLSVDQKEIRCFTIGTIKSLYEDDNHYREMSILATEFYLTARKYIVEHDEDFTWDGFYVDYYTNEDINHGGYWCTTQERVEKNILQTNERSPGKYTYALVECCNTGTIKKRKLS